MVLPSRLAHAPVRAAASDVARARFANAARLAGVGLLALAVPLLVWPVAGGRLLAVAGGLGLALWIRGARGRLPPGLAIALAGLALPAILACLASP